MTTSDKVSEAIKGVNMNLSDSHKSILKNIAKHQGELSVAESKAEHLRKSIKEGMLAIADHLPYSTPVAFRFGSKLYQAVKPLRPEVSSSPVEVQPLEII